MLRAPRAPYEIPTLLSQMVPKKIAENGTWKLFHWKGQISSCSQLPVGCISYLKLETMTTVRFYPRRMVHNEVVCHGSIAAASSSSPQHDQTKMIWLFQVAEISNSNGVCQAVLILFQVPRNFQTWKHSLSKDFPPSFVCCGPTCPCIQDFSKGSSSGKPWEVKGFSMLKEKSNLEEIQRSPVEIGSLSHYS